MVQIRVSDGRETAGGLEHEGELAMQAVRRGYEWSLSLGGGKGAHDLGLVDRWLLTTGCGGAGH